MKAKYFLFVFSIFVLIGCAAKPIVQRSEKSQLELREMQSSIVDSTDIKYISKVIVQVLQDDEYTINNLDSDLGYFTASKKLDGGREKYKFAFYDIYYPIAIYKASTLGRNILEVKATISIRVHSHYSQIRASFVSSLIDQNGNIQSVKTIDDQKFYQEFFAKVSKGLFLENNKL